MRSEKIFQTRVRLYWEKIYNFYLDLSTCRKRGNLAENKTGKFEIPMKVISIFFYSGFHSLQDKRLGELELFSSLAHFYSNPFVWWYKHINNIKFHNKSANS